MIDNNLLGRSLTQMIGTVLSSNAMDSQLIQSNGQQSVSGRPNRPPVADYFDTGRPPFLQIPQRDGRPPYPPRPQDGRPGYLGGLPPYPVPHGPPYPGGPGRYPQSNSVLQALTSIAQHDDLRCVPRLLCEVSSGARPSSGYYQPGNHYQQQHQQQSTIPFLSKDALVTWVLFIPRAVVLRVAAGFRENCRVCACRFSVMFSVVGCNWCLSRLPVSRRIQMTHVSTRFSTVSDETLRSSARKPKPLEPRS